MTASRTIVGALSGRELQFPNRNASPMPELMPSGVILDGEPVERFGAIDSSRGYPDVRSFRRKLGLLLPATNTSMEHELWSILRRNAHEPGLDGVGIHTANVTTPQPQLRSEADIVAYRRQFLGGLAAAIDQIQLAQPEYLIMGMSLEHVLRGLEQVRAPMSEVETYAGLPMTTCHDAIAAALDRLGARRIGLLTPFDRAGNENAKQLYLDLDVDVVATVGFSCANTLHIAHIPDWAKERAIVELLATPANRLDAVVQCGTNMSLIQVSERLEPQLGIPILGINAVVLWYALRENGFSCPLAGAGRLLREL